MDTEVMERADFRSKPVFSVFSGLSSLGDSRCRRQHDHPIHHLRPARLVRRDYLDGDEGKARRAAGVTSHLTEQELQDLIAFMLTLPIAE
jgi:hypothetical protein